MPTKSTDEKAVKMRAPGRWERLAAPALLKAWRGGRMQAQAAAALGIDLAKYNAFERGRQRPGIDIAFHIQAKTDGVVGAELWAQSVRQARARRAARSNAKAA